MTPVLSSLLDASIRISLVAVLVTALVYGFRVRSSSLRHKAWLSVLAAMLLMPVLSRVAPRIAIPIAAPGVSEVSEGISPELHLDATTAAIGGSGGAAETISKGLPAPIQATSITPAAPADRAFPWSALFAALYASGAALLLGRLFAGWRAARRIVAASRAVEVRGVSLYECSLLSSPVTVGLRSPKIVLPEDWTEWSEDKLSAVLAHEAAHVRRRDTLSSFFAHLNRCVFWFHPLSWWLERRLALDAEQACDDAGVLAVGGSGPYTEVLLDIAERARRGGRRMVLQGVGADGAGLLGPRIERLVRGAAGGRASAAQKMLLGGACAVAVFAGAACHRALPELKPDPKIAEDQKRSKAMQTEWEEIRKMNADQARALEASVAQNPEDIQLRNKLMRFYQSRGRDVLGDAAATSGFYAQQLWCIEHHPENWCSTITPPLFDGASFRKGAQLWESTLKREDLSADARINAVTYLQRPDPERAVAILKGANVDEKRRDRLLGGVYFDALTGPASASPFAQRVRKELDETKDAGLLSAVGFRLMWETQPINLGSALARRPEAGNLYETGRKYMERAAAIDPDLATREMAQFKQRDRLTKLSADLLTSGVSTKPSEDAYQNFTALSTADRARFAPTLLLDAYLTAGRTQDEKHDAKTARAQWDIARRYAKDALILAADPAGSSSKDELVYIANMMLGLIAERVDGDSHQAAQHLLAASTADAHDSPWQTFLIQKLCLLLLHYGGSDERQAVITFLDRQAKFMPQRQMDLALAAKQIREGTMPAWYQYQVAQLK